jgi:hypothetical protein
MFRRGATLVSIDPQSATTPKWQNSQAIIVSTVRIVDPHCFAWIRHRACHGSTLPINWKELKLAMTPKKIIKKICAIWISTDDHIWPTDKSIDWPALNLKNRSTPQSASLLLSFSQPRITGRLVCHHDYERLTNTISLRWTNSNWPCHDPH